MHNSLILMLKSLSCHLPSRRNPGERTDSVNMTHETIARHLGTAREVITRMLKHLVADGVIEVTRKGILITDKKKLRSIAY